MALIIPITTTAMLEKVEYFVERFLTRSFRVLVGMVCFFFAFTSGSEAYEIASRPLVALTIIAIFSVIFYCMLAYYLAWFGWFVAFGEGPTREEREKKKEANARIKAEQALEQAALIQLEQDQDLHRRERIRNHAAKVGRAVGRFWRNPKSIRNQKTS